MRFILLVTFMLGFLYSSSNISIAKTGEKSVKLGNLVTYNITIKNNSNTSISNIVIKDKIPPGFKYGERHTGKFVLRWNIKTLQVNEQRSFKYTLQTKQEGRFTSKAYFYIGGKKKYEVDFTTTVVKPKITVDLVCPKIAWPGKHIKATITVKNNGSINLSGVVVQGVNFSSYYRILSGEGNPAITGVSAIWNIGYLAVGETKSYSLTMTSRDCGKQCFTAIVSSNEGATAKSVSCTSWKCYPWLLLEVIDTIDPLTVNQETTYVIEVTNQGLRTDYYVKIEAVFPAEISPISAKGDTPCTVNGKRVTVEPYPILNVKQKIKWEIRAKAIQPGDSRLKVYMSSGALQKPVTEEESTHVY
ncbi:hypothetical protein [Candidatus Uabimicrobium sp. HlEnr_7]|uniref:hypothetical protein n=1 Tax=Candidatus Uabimicrobium helgolandensis TaxID=3095367 RepID=UPI003558124B